MVTNLMQKRKLVLYIAMSLDGYIAKQDDDISWLSTVEMEGEDYGYGEFIKDVDTVIVGYRTYEKVLSMGVDFPHTDKECYVISRKEMPAIGRLQFYAGNLSGLVSELKAKEGKTIFCDGGANTINMLLKDQQVDELIVSIIPVLLGDGIPLFQKSIPEIGLKLVECVPYKSGLVKLHYQKKE